MDKFLIYKISGQFILPNPSRATKRGSGEGKTWEFCPGLHVGREHSYVIRKIGINRKVTLIQQSKTYPIDNYTCINC